jgi:hypothetical protein
MTTKTQSPDSLSNLALSPLLIFLTLGCAASEEDLCALAGQHLRSCLGVAVPPPSECDVDLAQRVLATGCAELEDGVRGATGLFDDIEWGSLDVGDVGDEWAGWFGGGGTKRVLTVYGGPADSTAFQGLPACGGRRVDGQWYYATGKSTYGCGAKLEFRRGDRCVVVKVVDEGPSTYVDQMALQKCGSGVIDASPLVSRHLFGRSSAGWSDCFRIEVRQVSRSTPAGPCGGGGGLWSFLDSWFFG